MKIQKYLYKTAQRNTFAFDAKKCELVAQVDIESGREHRHRASTCYSRDKDKREVTAYFGVEEVAGTGYTITDEFENERDVVEPSEREKGDRIGHEVLRERLRVLRDQSMSLVSLGNSREIATVNTEISWLRKMLM